MSVLMFPGDHLGAPDPLPRALARELEAAVRTAATEAVAKALGDVKAAIAGLEAADHAAREALAAAAEALPDRLAPMVDQVVRAALADQATGEGPAPAARLAEAIDGAAAAAPAGGGMTEALLARVVDDWRNGVAAALADSLVPHAGAIADLAARVDGLDGQLATRLDGLEGTIAGGLAEQGGTLFEIGRGVRSAGDRLAALEALMLAQGAAIAEIAERLEALPAGAGPASIPLPAGSPAFQEQVLAKAVEDRLRPAFKAEIAAAMAPLAAEQKALAGKADSRAGAAEVAVRALRTHIKASVKTGREQSEQIGAVARGFEGIQGRLAFAVEALSGHAALLDRLRRRSRWMAILAVLNFVAALLVFAVVLADKYWYMLG